MTQPIGIDLGTTYSVVAVVDARGEAVTLANADGNLLTPSVVYFDGSGSATVGDAAKRLEAVAPDQVVSAIKRDMGTHVTRSFEGAALTPEGISAVILRGLVEQAASELGVPPSELRAVITVPAYFGVAEKEATAQAAEIAGLELMALVAEPVAAAISYGVDSGASGLVLAYDLGGGTFDTTVMEISESGPRVLVTDGSSRLGGLNWDERLADVIAQRYVHLAHDEDALDDDEFMQELVMQAEGVKKALTSRETGSISLTREGRTTRTEVTRAEFESACRDLVETTLEVVDRTLAAARARSTQPLEEVILVGGSTRMPMIAAALGAHLGVPVSLRDPDFAVAKGAALHAVSLDRAAGRATPASSSGLTTRGERGLALTPARTVLPRALGILLHDSHDPGGTRQIVQHIIPANSPLPVDGAESTFATILKDQDRVRIELFEQAGSVASEEVTNNRRVLDGELSGLPPLKAGSPIKIELSVAADGRITCRATEPKSKTTLVLESYMDGVVDGAEAESQRQVVTALQIVS